MKGKLFAVRCIPCVCFLLCFHAKTRGEGGMSRARCEKKASCKAMGILYPRTFGTVSCYASTPSTPSPASRSARLFVCVFSFLLSLRTLSLWHPPFLLRHVFRNCRFLLRGQSETALGAVEVVVYTRGPYRRVLYPTFFLKLLEIGVGYFCSSKPLYSYVHVSGDELLRVYIVMRT